MNGATGTGTRTGARHLATQIRHLVDPDNIARWVDPHRGRKGVKAFAIRQIEILVFTARQLVTEEISRRAAALTYYSLLSLVPLLSVGFALFEAFGGLASVEAPLKELIAESIAAGQAEEVGQWLDRFISNVNAGAIAGFGVLILFYSAIGLLTSIESAFNRIWGIQSERPWYIRFAIYWCIVTLAPPLIGLSISVSAQLQSAEFTVQVLEWLPFGLGRLVVSLGSVLAIALALVLIYIILPNTKVKLRCAIVGGIVASLLWNMTKALFIVITAGSVKYSAIYGALSTLPLLMLWMYVSWNVVLLGVSYTNAYQTMTGSRLEATPEMSPADCERLATRLAIEIAREFVAGSPAPTAEQLATATGTPRPSVQHVLGLLTTAGIVAETGRGGDGIGYLPARDLTASSLADVVDGLRHLGPDEHPITDDETQRRLDELLGAAHEATRKTLSAASLRESVTVKE